MEGNDRKFKEIKPQKRRRKSRKKSRIIQMVIIIIIIVIEIFLIIKIIGIKGNYDEGVEIYSNIAEKVVLKEQIVDLHEQESIVLSLVDFNALKEINPDIVAWIYFEEPSVINYPVTVGRDNAYYLTHTFTGESNSAGCVFIDQVASSDLTDTNLIMYGHNMKNGSMFAGLMNYHDETFGKANPDFYIYTKNGGIYKCTIFSIYTTGVSEGTYCFNFESEQSYQEYLDRCVSRSDYDFGYDVSSNNRIVTLSTCTNRSDLERFVVQAAISEVIREGEPEIGVITW